MARAGFIKIHRSILSWEWYTDTNTMRLFLHLLLTVNYEPGRWQGIEINRGQRVCSLPALSEETGLSIQQTRTALKRLISTGSVTDQATNRYRLITVVNYDKFQDVINVATAQPTDGATGEQQAINRPANSQSTAIKEIKKKEEKELIINTPLTPLETIEKGTLEEKAMREDLEAAELSPALKSKAREWAEYKKEKRQDYKPRGFKSLLTTIGKKVSAHGETAVLDLITESMGANWQGIAWGRLEEKGEKKGKGRPKEQGRPPKEKSMWEGYVDA